MLLNPYDTDSLKAYLLLYKLFFHPIESLEIMLMNYGSERRMEALDMNLFQKRKAMVQSYPIQLQPEKAQNRYFLLPSWQKGFKIKKYEGQNETKRPWEGIAVGDFSSRLQTTAGLVCGAQGQHKARQGWRKTKRKQNKAKKDVAGKQGKRELSNMKRKLLTYRFHKRVLCWSCLSSVLSLFVITFTTNTIFLHFRESFTFVKSFGRTTGKIFWLKLQTGN